MDNIFNMFILFGFGAGVFITLTLLAIIVSIIYFVNDYKERKQNKENRKE